MADPSQPEVPGPRSTQDRAPAVASLPQRLCARALDTGIVVMLTGAVESVYFGLFSRHDALTGALPVGLALALPSVVFFLYEGAWLAHDGQSPGKRAVGIRVASYADGGPPGRSGWGRAAVYALPGAVFCLGYLFWLLNVLSCLWDQPYRQCLHDKTARTVVVTA